MNTSLNFSNGKENKITKRYYCDNSSEIIPEDYESTDQIYAINDNKLYEIEVSNEKTASGSIASFSDGADNVPVEALSVALEPVQDLHGQSSPYPSGGGKNKLPLTVDGIKALNPNTRGTWNGNKYEYNGITYEIVTDSDGNVAKIHVSGTRTGSTYFNLARIDSVPYGTYILNGGVSGASVRAYHFDGTNSVTSIGPDVTFTSTEDTGNNTFDIFPYSDSALNVDIYPMIRLSTVTDSTYAPYSNICPITGHSTAQVWRAGTNIFDESVFADLGAVLQEDGTYYFQTASAFLNNVIWTNDSGYTGALNIAIKYRYSSASSSGVRPIVHYTDGTSIQLYMPATTTESTYTYTTNSAKSVSKITLTYGSGSIDTWWNFAMSPQSLTTYEPYTATHISIPLGQTVYGGSIDVVGGKVVVDRAIDTITKDGAWYGFATGTGNSSAVIQLAEYQNVLYVDGSSSHNGAISSTGSEEANYWVNARQNEMPTAGDMCFAYSATGQLRFHRLDVATITDIASFKANFPDTQVCYKLATPITIDLTDIPELTTLYGTNNIWSDSGDVSVTYKSSIQQHIAKVISNAIS